MDVPCKDPVIANTGIVAFLDKIPVWKKFRSLPARLDALEKKVEELKKQSEKPEDLCPECHKEELQMKPVVSAAKYMTYQYQCQRPSCGYIEIRKIKSW